MPATVASGYGREMSGRDRSSPDRVTVQTRSDSAVQAHCCRTAQDENSPICTKRTGPITKLESERKCAWLAGCECQFPRLLFCHRNEPGSANAIQHVK